MSMTATYACARHCYVGAGPCWFCADERDAAKHCVLHVDQPLEHGTCRYCYADHRGEVASPPYRGLLAKPPAAAKLPTDHAARKATPIATGVLDYFPLAMAEIARVSKAGNDQHNPGEPLHWDRTKSLDHADCIVRHLLERGTVDSDGQRHSAKMAWRALALLQTELEQEASR